MGEITYACDDEETEGLVEEDDETTRLNDLTFPLPLIKLVNDFQKAYRRSDEVFKKLHLGISLMLVFYFTYSGFRSTWLALDLFFICLAFLSVLAVCVQTLPTFDHVKPSVEKRLSSHECDNNQCLTNFALLLIALSIIGFFAVFVWLAVEMTFVHFGSFIGPRLIMQTCALILFISDTVGIGWLIYSRIQHHARMVSRSDKIGQSPKQLSNHSKCIRPKLTTASEKTTENDAQADRDLTLLSLE